MLTVHTRGTSTSSRFAQHEELLCGHQTRPPGADLLQKMSTSSGSVKTTSTRSQSDCGSSIFSEGLKYDANVTRETARARQTKSRWLTHVKDWLSVSEPSAQAMKQQKRNIYKKHGIDMKDPQAAAKLHLPIGRVPEGAVTSTSGPSPEKALKKAMENQVKSPLTGSSLASQSISSGISSSSSTREFNPVAPWET